MSLTSSSNHGAITGADASENTLLSVLCPLRSLVQSACCMDTCSLCIRCLRRCYFQFITCNRNGRITIRITMYSIVFLSGLIWFRCIHKAPDHFTSPVIPQFTCQYQSNPPVQHRDCCRRDTLKLAIYHEWNNIGTGIFTPPLHFSIFNPLCEKSSSLCLGIVLKV